MRMGFAWVRKECILVILVVVVVVVVVVVIIIVDVVVGTRVVGVEIDR